MTYYDNLSGNMQILHNLSGNMQILHLLFMQAKTSIAYFQCSDNNDNNHHYHYYSIRAHVHMEQSRKTMNLQSKFTRNKMLKCEKTKL